MGPLVNHGSPSLSPLSLLQGLPHPWSWFGVSVATLVWHFLRLLSPLFIIIDAELYCLSGNFTQVLGPGLGSQTPELLHA